MAVIANVALTNTFDTWRTRTNIALTRLNAFTINESSLYANTLTSNTAFTAKGTATVTGLFTASGRATVGTNLTVSGNTTLGGASKTLTIGGSSSTLTIGGTGSTANATGWFGITGRASVSTNLHVAGNTFVMGTGLGIGTSTPSYRVHIYGGSTSASRILNIEGTTSSGSQPPILLFSRTNTALTLTDQQGSIFWSRTLTDSSIISSTISSLGSNDSTAPVMYLNYNAYTRHQFAVNSTEIVRVTNGGLHNYANTTLNGTTIDKSNALSQTLTDGATINWDVALGRVATVTLGAAGRTMAAPTNLKVGTYILRVYQDATGSRTITTWNSVFKWTAAVAPVLSTGANKLDIITFFSDGTNLYGSYLPDMR